MYVDDFFLSDIFPECLEIDMWANSKILYCVQIVGRRNCDVYQIFYVSTLFP